jgi:predicted tellurium resistance membrane protein TerC
VINKQFIQKISNQEMDRKAFLKYSGLVVLSVVGLKTVLTAIDRVNNQLPTTTSSNAVTPIATRGFGSGKYGA